MQFTGAKVREQGQTFGIVVVKPHVLHDHSAQASIRDFGIRAFGQIPIVLMARDSRGVATYQGRPDIVGYLSHLVLSQIPWKRYSLS